MLNTEDIISKALYAYVSFCSATLKQTHEETLKSQESDQARLTHLKESHHKQIHDLQMTEKRLRSEVSDLRAKVNEQLNDLERSRMLIDQQAAKMARSTEDSMRIQV